jgi:hypothetical protein
MSIADKLIRLNETKTLIRAVIIGKGVDVPEQYTFRQLADRVAEIGGITAYEHNVMAPAWMPVKIAYLYKTKQLIKNVIQAKGVSPGDNFRDYIFKIAQIPGGGVIAFYPGDPVDPIMDGFYPVEA